MGPGARRSIKFELGCALGFEEECEPGFNTPTGKIELVSTVLEQYGFEGLPVYEEPVYSPVSTPELAMDYPLVLNSGGRVPYYTHSKLRALPWLNQFMPEPVVLLHPTDAEARDFCPITGFPPFRSGLCEVAKA